MGKWQTSVASSAYNMAGDVSLRPNLMAGNVASHVLSGSNKSIGSAIHESIVKGNANRQRRFFAWAKENYTYGIPTGDVSSEIEVDDATVRTGLRPVLGLYPNQYLIIDEAYIDDADAGFWVEKWMEANHPNIGPEGYTYLFSPNQGEGGSILVFIDGQGVETLTPDADLLWGADRTLGRKLLYVTYRTITDNGDKTTTASNTLYFTYRMGTGNPSFDTLLGSLTNRGEFFPPIPLRLHNKSIDHADFSGEYANLEEAYKKLTGGKIEEVLNQINDHESVGDMDHVFITPGVSLNTEDQSALEYLYIFFRDMMTLQRNDKEDFENYVTAARSRSRETVTWERWTSGLKSEYHPMHGLAAPAEPSANGSPTLSQIEIKMADLEEFNFKIKWAYVSEELRSGQALPLAPLKVGEFAIVKGFPFNMSYTIPSTGHDESEPRTVSQSYDRIYLYHQTGQYSYKRLEIVGLEHNNYVYGLHAVRMTSGAALDEAEESAFIIPLHEPTVRAMGLKKGNQLATANLYLVINAYERRKKKWYERGLGRFLLFLFVVALGFVFPGLGAAAMSIGNATLAVLGISTSSLFVIALVGSAVSYLAGMVVSTVIMKAAVSLFGEEWGTVLGTVAAVVAMTFGAGMVSNTTTGWENVMQMFQPENLVHLTTVATDAYTAWLNADTAGIYEDMVEAQEESQDKLEELKELAEDVLGMTNTSIDPILFTDIAPEHLGESSESFQHRTLMTASDFHDLNELLISEFAEISLELPDLIS